MRSRHRKRKRESDDVSGRIPVLALAAGILLLGLVAVGLLIGARLLDHRMNKTAVEADAYAEDIDTQYYESYARGSVVLNGTTFDYFHNFENYLIMGTDISGNEAGVGEDHQNSMADFLLLMSIDKTADTYSLLELNRDTITSINVLGADDRLQDIASMQLCTAHWYGSTTEVGCRNQVKAVSEMLGGLPINGYYAISMNDIGLMNHAIGGVTVTLDDDMSQLDPAMKKGATLTLTDEQAAVFLRSRMSVGQGLNTERMARQHQYLEGFLQKGAESIRTAPRYFYGVFEALEQVVVTNLTGKQISRIAKALTQNARANMASFAGEYETGQRLGDGIDHMEFYLADLSLYTVMTEIFGLIPERDETAALYDELGDAWLDVWGSYVYEPDTDDLEDFEDVEDFSEETEHGGS